MQRTIALTGGTGLIGRKLVQRLQRAGEVIRLLSRQVQPPMENVICIQGDLRDAQALARLTEGASAVVHLGGIAHASLRSEAEKTHAREINVQGTLNLLDASKLAGVGRFILASTAHVYSGQRGVGLTEQAPVAGDSFYALLKLEAEAAAQAAAMQGLDVVIVRPCIVYGQGVRFNLASLMRAVQRGYYFHAGGADPLRSFASVDTVAAAIVHLLQHGHSGQAYNIADREPAHLVAWVNDLARRMGAHPPRTLPMPLLRAGAATLDPLAKLGLPAPLTTEKLDKLTASFSLDVSALEATGFVWPSTTHEMLDEMVAAFARTQA